MIGVVLNTEVFENSYRTTVEARYIYLTHNIVSPFRKKVSEKGVQTGIESRRVAEAFVSRMVERVSGQNATPRAAVSGNCSEETRAYDTLVNTRITSRLGFSIIDLSTKPGHTSVANTRTPNFWGLSLALHILTSLQKRASWGKTEVGKAN